MLILFFFSQERAIGRGNDEEGEEETEEDGDGDNVETTPPARAAAAARRSRKASPSPSRPVRSERGHRQRQVCSRRTEPPWPSCGPR